MSFPPLFPFPSLLPFCLFGCLCGLWRIQFDTYAPDEVFHCCWFCVALPRRRNAGLDPLGHVFHAESRIGSGKGIPLSTILVGIGRFLTESE